MNMWANNRYESFWCDPYFDSREEAIKDGIKQYEDSMNGIASELFDEDYFNGENTNPDGVFYIGHGFDFHPVIDAELIIEHAQEEAYDVCGEAAEDYLDWYYISDEDIAKLQSGLQQVFDVWLEDRNFKLKYFDNIEEIHAVDYVKEQYLEGV